MYTQACDFYRTLNACLRNRNRETIKPFFSYLRLLLEALRQLPAQKRTVYRGVKLDLSAKFRKGDEPVWWSVTSTSTTMEVLQSKEFCGTDGPRTVFVVQVLELAIVTSAPAAATSDRDSSVLYRLNMTSWVDHRRRRHKYCFVRVYFFAMVFSWSPRFLFIVHCSGILALAGLSRARHCGVQRVRERGRADSSSGRAAGRYRMRLRR
jgi:hypothetical protein